MRDTWILWGRMKGGTPIRIDAGSLAEMRKELDYRKPLQVTGGWTGLVIRKEGHAYVSCSCGVCGTSHDPEHPSWEVRH